jgi:hypothetical protein
MSIWRWGAAAQIQQDWPDRSVVIDRPKLEIDHIGDIPFSLRVTGS